MKEDSVEIQMLANSDLSTDYFCERCKHRKVRWLSQPCVSCRILKPTNFESCE